MVPEIGNFSLIFALVLAFIQVWVSFSGAYSSNELYMKAGISASRGLAIFMFIAFSCLCYSFFVNDFSVLYVASNSNTALPIQYKFAAVWGGHEGSMLLWATTLSAWMLAVTIFSKNLPEVFKARLLGTMGLIAIGFLIFILFSSNPFDRLIPATLEGRDLNPLLQDPGMVFHPPVLYMGYVGFSVAFGFAIAALLGGKLDYEWARWTRTWTTAAWVFLTVGIAFGSKWAYYELGWGGWWFWDAVENASFMPWLVGTALIHSLSVTEKREAFKMWTVLLAIFAFSLSLLGTFLVRSGVLTSVHAFATDPKRGLFILVFLALVVGGSLLLFAIKAPKVGLGVKFGLFSRETTLLFNNVIMVVAAGVVMLGTLYPLFLDALGLGKISVGPPYFDSVFVPVMFPAIIAMGFSIFVKWKQANFKDTAIKLKIPFILSIILAILVPIILGKLTLWVFVGLLMAYWVIFSSLLNLYLRFNRIENNLIQFFINLPRAYLGMIIAHIGVGVFIIGVTMVKGYEVEKDFKMTVGQSTVIQNYKFTFKSIKDDQGPNYVAALSTFEVSKNDQVIEVMHPEKRMYTTQSMPMTEAAISPGLFKDWYISLGEPLDDNYPQSWAVRIYIKPFVQWIWVGALMMGAGGIFAMFDRRYRKSKKQE